MSYDTSKMSVEEIRDELVNTFGMGREAVDSIKGKANLVQFLIAHQNGPDEENNEEVLLNAQQEDESMPDIKLFTAEVDEYNESIVGVSEDKQEYLPIPTDPDWSDYVMSKLTESEMFKGSPKVSGLRRVTELLLGEIIHSHTVVMQCPGPDNEHRATVTHQVTIHTPDGIDKSSTGAADAYSGNSDKIFSRHPVALAETRAEGRALRRLLRLHGSVVTAEEKIETVEEFTGFNSVDDSKIQEIQINMLNVVGSRNSINLQKVVNKFHPGVNNIRELSYTDGINLCNTLSSYQSTGVPEDLKGYDSTWLSKLGNTA